MCVKQPWWGTSLWSVADRSLSTFSFILICGSSLSFSHAENEVSRLETGLKFTCQISLFCLHIRFMARLWRKQRVFILHCSLIAAHAEEKALYTRYDRSYSLRLWKHLYCYSQPHAVCVCAGQLDDVNLSFRLPIVQMWLYHSGRYTALLRAFQLRCSACFAERANVTSDKRPLCLWAWKNKMGRDFCVCVESVYMCMVVCLSDRRMNAVIGFPESFSCVLSDISTGEDGQWLFTQVEFNCPVYRNVINNLVLLWDTHNVFRC